MKRQFLCGLAAFLTVPLLSAPASASNADGACLTTLISALVTDVTTNGPVRSSGGTITVGSFTPSAFISGATGPAGTYVTCTV